jgi:predicted DNA-binding transcriptional regulator AlpA
MKKDDSTPTAAAAAAPLAAANQLLILREVCHRLHVSRWTVLRLLRQGKFPPPVRLLSRRLLWRPEAIEQHVMDAERGPGNAVS